MLEYRTGSLDQGDPETTNVHVGNLPPNITEESLGNFFCKCGSIGSVKIMWPRSNINTGSLAGDGMTALRKNNAGGLNGFVAFMKRRDAERAIKEMDGFTWGGSVLRCGWGKSMPMPTRPIYGTIFAMHYYETFLPTKQSSHFYQLNNNRISMS